ncbi:hypothetical protein FYJ25_00225 [Anaerobutyricum soehngenii]|uniref:Uncharacterized protein n=1 Tax=Anaerobutyricum soehngenii TaxID=105843 RepID=A0A6N7XXT1_9FIRM|nr:hypothetical protein [Anaerobutyricum soehngenii]
MPNRLNQVPVNGFDVAPVGATFVAVTATKGATSIFYCHISLLYHVVGATSATFFSVYQKLVPQKKR